MSPRVAFVVQRCGLEVNGGAELLCRMVAERLAAQFPTEVLTTCALDYMTWENHYPAGEECLGDLLIRRFPVARSRDVESFNRLSASLQPRIRSANLREQEEWMRQQGPWSPALFDHLKAKKGDYDAFIFVTYLYATTYFGLPLVPEKALLVPLGHDEWPIQFGMWDRFFELPRGFIFSSEEELAFLRRRFPAASLNGPVVGTAVDPPAKLSPDAFRETYGIDGPFVVYVGRMDPAKGVGELLHHFRAYQRQTGDSRTQLVLIGRPAMELAVATGVRALGFVSEQHKWDALAACDALVMPSPYESLSIALLEAWSVGKPVLVSARSEVLLGQCRRSQGGLWYSDSDEFCAALEYLLTESAVRRGLGEQGRRYVAANYRWAGIVEKYRELIRALSP